MGLPVRLDEDGALAPPRSNGELAFSAPWESRLFGLTMALVEAGRLDWEAFRGRLIGAIAAWEGAARDEEWNYWQCWQEAFEDSLEAAGLVATPEIDRLTGQLAARPHGHDHGHGHDHDHRHDDHHEHAMGKDE
ncbi:MAG: nitrile hydratase accessory protein [Acidobacteriota bacterium]|nr:nitrile hydratase accessory protein [Acidobacteriota bacterium]MDE2921809.1 nitrile hydratase accessory protein [Acidobacteriota bacterium]MDE3266659.1 nitrile hydratase accessory protein [Acidobacteriota bacterium]